MARPSLKEERREQILAAFETCVARYGVEGATLELVAGEAGLARSLIRHNVGNREELLKALIERFLVRSGHAIENMTEALPAKNRAHAMIEWLFHPDYSDTELMLLSEALIAASADDKRLAAKMRQWIDSFIKTIEDVIQSEYPKAKKTDVAVVAAGVTGIYFNVESLTPLGNMPGLVKASHKAAALLLKSLE